MRYTTLAVLASAALTGTAHAQLPQSRVLTLDVAQALAQEVLDKLADKLK